ncbi:MAG: MFS transporter [Brevundimonas sp.]
MTARPRSQIWLILYALAWGGGVIAYTPLLTLLLPLKLGLDPGQKVAALSLVTVVGAVTASVSNILAGHLSDRWRHPRWGRRPFVWAGLAATGASYAAVAASQTLLQTVLSVIAFQTALNLMLAPLAALAADEAPDEQKGRLGGLMGAAYPLGALSGILVVAAPEGAARFVTAFAAAAVMITPFLLFGRPAPAAVDEAALRAPRRRDRANLAAVWLARFFVQIAGGVLFAFALYYFETLNAGDGPLPTEGVAARLATILGVAAVLTAPASIALGVLSDRLNVRRVVLQGLAAAVALSLLIMALAPEWRLAAPGYVLFIVAQAVFLALQQTYVMRLLPSPAHRGRDLGVLNLTNTLPSTVGPTLAYAVITLAGYDALMLVLAGLAAGAGALMTFVKEPRGPTASGPGERRRRLG